jgi:RHS repeat-associated protein
MLGVLNKSRAAKPDPRVSRANGSGNVETQVYHGTRYIDEVISQRLPHGRVYVHQDANWNVTALTDLTGRVLERNWYSPYGELEVSHEAHFFDFDADGDVDDDDLAAADTNGVCRDNYAGAGGDCKRLDADGDGDVNSADYLWIMDFRSQLTSTSFHTRLPIVSKSIYPNAPLFQGLTSDDEIGTLHNRARQVNIRLRRHVQADPLGRSAAAGAAFQDGMSLYGYLRSMPYSKRDPSGLACAIGATNTPSAYSVACNQSWITCLWPKTKTCVDCQYCPCGGSLVTFDTKCSGCKYGNTPPAAPGCPPAPTPPPLVCCQFFDFLTTVGPGSDTWQKCIDCCAAYQSNPNYGTFGGFVNDFAGLCAANCESVAGG